MKHTILWITLLRCFFTFGQTATEYFESGKQKEEENEFEEAIKEYGKAIEMDPTFAEAYYVRASLLYDTDKYQEAITDLNKTISLKPSPIEFYIAALELRGKSNLKIKNKEKACHDFIEAKQLGASIDEQYLQLCGFKVIKKEQFFVNIPDKENWKITDQSYKNNQHIILIANTKTSEYLNLTSHIEVKSTDLTKAMNDSYKITKGKSQDTKLSLIGKDLKAKEPWIMYVIQNIINEECNCKESQVWYLVQGENCLHTCFIATGKEPFTNEKKEEFIKVLKTAKIIYQ